MRLIPILSSIVVATSLALPVFAQDSAVKIELKAYNDRYNEIAANHDLEAFLALYGDEPLWIAPAKPPVAGLEVPAGTFGYIVENKGKFSHSFDHFYASEDGTQAVMIGTYDLDVEKADVTAKGTYLFVMKRDGDDWKIVADMFNQHAAN